MYKFLHPSWVTFEATSTAEKEFCIYFFFHLFINFFYLQLLVKLACNVCDVLNFSLKVRGTSAIWLNSGKKIWKIVQRCLRSITDANGWLKTLVNFCHWLVQDFFDKKGKTFLEIRAWLIYEYCIYFFELAFTHVQCKNLLREYTSLHGSGKSVLKPEVLLSFRAIKADISLWSLTDANFSRAHAIYRAKGSVMYSTSWEEIRMKILVHWDAKIATTLVCFHRNH